MKNANRYSPEVRERAVRLVLTTEHEHSSRWAATQSVATKIGCSAETLRAWINKLEVDSGYKSGTTTDQAQRFKVLERENRELKRANEILRKAAAFFRPGGARPPTQEMIAFIGQHRCDYGVEPICTVLPIAPSTYYHRKILERDPERRSNRTKTDEVLEVEISRVFNENHGVYGAHKVYKQLNREAITVGRCTVERLMRRLEIEGVRRGRRCRTTIPSDTDKTPLDLVNRQFVAIRPNQLWVADITYGAPSLQRCH